MFSTQSARDIGALCGPLIGASFLGGVVGALKLARSPYPRPGSDGIVIHQYFLENAGPARLSAVGQAVSAASLLPFTWSAATAIGRSNTGSRGTEAAAWLGGSLAAASLAMSARSAFALINLGEKEMSEATALHRRGFAAGGPIHGVGFGTLVGALALVGWHGHVMPRPLAVMGLASACSGLLSISYFLVPAAGWLIPIGRFPGLIFCGVVGIELGRRSMRWFV